jgi:hypothetical protein
MVDIHERFPPRSGCKHIPDQADLGVLPRDARFHDRLLGADSFVASRRQMMHGKVIVRGARTPIFGLLFCSQFVYLRIGNQKPRRDL